MIHREAANRILHLAKEYPAVIVAGPRHSGKTTLAKMLFPHHKYVNFEANPEERSIARKRPGDFFKRHSGKIIIDEFLLAPELLAFIRAVSNRADEPGQIILVSSILPQNTGLMRTQAVHQATQILLPLSFWELQNAGINLERDEYMHRGFMPGAHSENADPPQLYLDYLTSYVSHEAKMLITPYDRKKFEKFLKLLARRIGQIINPASVAKELRVSLATLAMWMSALEATFVIFKLPCYYKSLGMRIARIPKFYFVDVGMAACLLGIKTPDQIFRDPLVGNLFENMVVAEALKSRFNTGQFAGLYYFRHHHQRNLEVDLIIEQAKNALPVEIKCAAEINSSYAKNVAEFSDMSYKFGAGCVVYGGETKEKSGVARFVNFREVEQLARG